MKFEIELTEEEAKHRAEHYPYCFSPISKKINDQIRAQLRSELPKEKGFKFLVGYINLKGDLAKRGKIHAHCEQDSITPEKIYGFTFEQLVEFRKWLDLNKARPSFDNYTEDVRLFLQTQEADQ